MTTTMSRNDHHRMSIFGKVRHSMSNHGHESRTQSITNFHSTSNINASTNANSHAISAVQVGPKGWVTNVPAKKRRSIWRKGSKEGIAQIPELPPALTLTFDEKTPVEKGTQEETALVRVPVDDEKMLTRTLSKRGSRRRSSSIVAPTPAAAVALAAVSKATPASPEVQLKYHRSARLRVPQATELIQLCSQEIKMRGLATVGIFRPFRLSESLDQQERLIELFLLYNDPKTYDNVFSISNSPSSALFHDALGKPDAEGEFKKKLSYAKVYDVIALLKWGLRRLKLDPEDVGSIDQYSWYNNFLEKEKVAKYPAKAYTELLLPTLPKDTRELFNAILEIMSTVSAHHIANAMSASKICKILGFWLVGRIGSDHSPHDLESLIKSWEKSSKIMEHLLMAYVRDQATQIHLMPSRLMEIVADYPYTHLNQKAPSLKPQFSSKPIKAILVDVKSENIIISTKKPRSPSETLRAALKAQGTNVESSEELDDWSAILGVACTMPAAPVSPSLDDLLLEGKVEDDENTTEIKETEEEMDARKELALFKEDDARILRIVSSECDRRRAKSDSDKKRGNLVSSNSNTPFSELGNYSMSRSTSEGSDGRGLPFLPTSSSLASSTFRGGSMRTAPSYLGTLVEDSNGNSKSAASTVDWSAFTSGGFGTEADTAPVDLKLNEAYKPKSALERAFEEEDRAAMGSSMKRHGSLGTLRRKKPYRNQYGSISSSNLTRVDTTPTYTLTKVSSMAFDEAFVLFWQDQLLDDCIAVRLPYLLVSQLNQSTANRMLGSGMGQSISTNWLIVTETAIPPRPPIPQSNSATGRSLGMLRRGNSSVVEGFQSNTTNNEEEEEDAASERRSIFAPSIRSSFSTSLSKTKNRMKRMSSLLSVRNAATRADKMKRDVEIDQEIKELQEAVQSKRKLAAPVPPSEANSHSMEVLKSSTEIEERSSAKSPGNQSRNGTIYQDAED